MAEPLPRYFAARDPARRPAGFVERDCGIPEPRCDHGPALGKAGGDAGPPPRTRQAGLRLRCMFRAGCLAAKPQAAFGRRGRRPKQHERRPSKRKVRANRRSAILHGAPAGWPWLGIARARPACASLTLYPEAAPRMRRTQNQVFGRAAVEEFVRRSDTGILR